MFLCGSTPHPQPSNNPLLSPLLQVVDLLHSLNERLLGNAPALWGPSPAWVRAWFTVLTGLSSVATNGLIVQGVGDHGWNIPQ
jgi:hypothetical protein